jgi:hypothetical protein
MLGGARRLVSKQGRREVVATPPVETPSSKVDVEAPARTTTLEAIVPRADLARLVASITPLRVTIGPGRAVNLDGLTLELVAGRGVRLRGSGTVSWDFAHVPIPVRVNACQILLVPRLGSADGSHVLSFEPLLENLQVKSAPGLADETIAAAIRRAIEGSRSRLAWDFGRTLSTRLPLSPKVSPTSTLALFPVGGAASVSDRELRIVLRFESRLEVERGQARSADARDVTESGREEVSPAVRPPPRLHLGRPLPHKRPPPAKGRTLRRPALRLRGGRTLS